jgi:hypothetical protein
MGTSKPPRAHHVVPRFYLARFADAAGHLHVYGLKTQQFRKQRPASVMVVNDYYHQPWAGPGADPYIMERSLGQWLEPRANSAMKMLVQDPQNLNDDQMAILLAYFEFQRIRVPRQAEAGLELMRETLLRLMPPESAAAIERGEFTLTMKESARFDYIRSLNGKLTPWFANMEWEIFEAAPDAAFVTTDSPVSLYNSRVPPPAEAGLALAGTMVFFPLSSQHALIMRHPAVSERDDDWQLKVLTDLVLADGQIAVSRGAVWSKEVVDRFNWKMMKLARRFVVAMSAAVLADAGIHQQ